MRACFKIFSFEISAIEDTISTSLSKTQPSLNKALHDLGQGPKAPSKDDGSKDDGSKVERSPICLSYNCFIRWVLILSRSGNRISPISDARAQADNIRRSILKHSYYLTKSGICMRTFHIAQICIHRNVSRESDVQPMLKNLVVPSSNYDKSVGVLEKIAVMVVTSSADRPQFTRNAFGTCLDSIARNSHKMVEILHDLSKIYSKPM